MARILRVGEHACVTPFVGHPRRQGQIRRRSQQISLRQEKSQTLQRLPEIGVYTDAVAPSKEVGVLHPPRHTGLIVVDEQPTAQLDELAFPQAQDDGLHAVSGGSQRCRQCDRTKQPSARKVVPCAPQLLRIVELPFAEGELSIEQRASRLQVCIVNRDISEIHSATRRHLEGHRCLLPTRIELHIVADLRMGEALTVQPDEQLALIGDHLAITEDLVRPQLQPAPQDRRQQTVLSGELQIHSRDRPLTSRIHLQGDVQAPFVVQGETAAHDVDIHVATASIQIFDHRQICTKESACEALPNLGMHGRP